MAINLVFGGARIKRPGAYSTVDTSGIAPSSTGSLAILAIVGQMAASATIAPKTVTYFNDPAIAREALKEGEFLTAAEKAWEHGADLIAFVRVDDAVQATGAIGTVFNATAKAFGTSGNAVTVEAEDKTIGISNGVVLEQFTQAEGETNEAFAKRVSKFSVFVNLASTGEGTIEAPVEPTLLSGGAGGAAVTDEDWQDALNKLSTESIQGIIPITTETALQVKVDAHVQAMSSTKNRKERRAFYGHPVNATLLEIKALMDALGNERALLATPAVQVVAADGDIVDVSSVHLAAAMAGMWASKEPQDPITFDYVNFAGLAKQYNADEIEELLAMGTSPVEFVNGRGYRIVQGLTGDISGDLSKNELSLSTLKDVMSRDMRETLENRHVGSAGVPGIDITVFNDAMSRINVYLAAGYISEYVDGTLKIVQEGTAYRVDWEGKPTLPVNNFLITSHFTI